MVENSEGVVCIHTDDEKLAHAMLELLAEKGLTNKAVMVRDASACKGMPTILVAQKTKPPENLEYLMLVSPGARGSKLGLTRLQAVPLQGGVYRLRIGHHTILVREEDGRLCEPRDMLIYQVAEAARRAVREYGPLPIRDVVQLVAQELGLSRSEARRLLYEAISAGLVRVEAGSVTL